MQFLKKVFGDGNKKKIEKDEGLAKTNKKGLEGKNYEEGAQALSPREKVSPAQFKKNVQDAVAQGLTRERFMQLCVQYNSLNNLEKYAVSSWLVAQYPELEQAIRSQDYDLYVTLKGQ